MKRSSQFDLILMLIVLIISFNFISSYNNRTSSLNLGSEQKSDKKFVQSSPSPIYLHNNHIKASNRYVSYARNITISLPDNVENCNALVSDVVSYRANNVTMIEHMLLHNNFDKIVNLKISSPQFKNLRYKYNDKINVVSLFLSNTIKVGDSAIPSETTSNQEFLLKRSNQSFTRVENNDREEGFNFSVTYEFIAVNINKLEFTDSNTVKSNYIIWKIINQNSHILDETEIFFSYRLPYHIYDSVSSNISISPEGFKFIGINHSNTVAIAKLEVPDKLSKVLKKNSTNTGNLFLINNDDLNELPEDNEIEREMYDGILYAEFLWNGVLSANKVQITKLSFPFQYTKCEPLRINILMIGIGSLFVAFVIVMIYVVVTSLTLEKL